MRVLANVAFQNGYISRRAASRGQLNKELR